MLIARLAVVAVVLPSARWPILVEAQRCFAGTPGTRAFVRPKRPTDRSLAYAQGHWMYQYMIEKWGEAREEITQTLMKALAHDRRKDQATGKDLPYLQVAWRYARGVAFAQSGNGRKRLSFAEAHKP